MRVSFFFGAAVLLRKIGRLRAGDVGREAGKGIRSAEGYRAGPRQEGAKKQPGGHIFISTHCGTMAADAGHPVERIQKLCGGVSFVRSRYAIK